MFVVIVFVVAYCMNRRRFDFSNRSNTSVRSGETSNLLSFVSFRLPTLKRCDISVAARRRAGRRDGRGRRRCRAGERGDRRRRRI